MLPAAVVVPRGDGEVEARGHHDPARGRPGQRDDGTDPPEQQGSDEGKAHQSHTPQHRAPGVVRGRFGAVLLLEQRQRGGENCWKGQKHPADRRAERPADDRRPGRHPSTKREPDGQVGELHVVQLLGPKAHDGVAVLRLERLATHRNTRR